MLLDLQDAQLKFSILKISEKKKQEWDVNPPHAVGSLFQSTFFIRWNSYKDMATC